MPKIIKANLRRIGDKEYDCRKYQPVKSATGNSSLDCGDGLADELRGKDLNEVYKLASRKLKVSQRSLKGKYKHLNPGMQRMNLGNRLRAVM